MSALETPIIVKKELSFLCCELGYKDTVRFSHLVSRCGGSSGSGGCLDLGNRGLHHGLHHTANMGTFIIELLMGLLDLTYPSLQVSGWVRVESIGADFLLEFQIHVATQDMAELCIREVGCRACDEPIDSTNILGPVQEVLVTLFTGIEGVLQLLIIPGRDELGTEGSAECTEVS